MKMKKIITIFMLVMTLSLFSAPAKAATKPTDADWKTAPIISNLRIEHDDIEAWFEVDIVTPANVQNAIAYSEEGDNCLEVGGISAIQLKYNIDGKYEDLLDMFEKNPEEVNGTHCGVYRTSGLNELHVDSEVTVQCRYRGSLIDTRYSDWSNSLDLNKKEDFMASPWALTELEQASSLNLIPDCLAGQDLTKPITRAEFAAVSVKVYEALTGKKAVAANVNPFVDTNDTEVLKAYNIGVTTGVSDTEFAPNVLLNREQAATMLTRVYKTVNNITDLNYTKPSLFSDDKNISSWAYDSVYFMAAKGIIKGMDGNKFAPRNATTAEEAAGFANATREQSLLIAVRMVENLK